MNERPFRFGVQCWSAQTRQEWGEKARRAESLGFSVLVVPDHFGGQFAPVAALMAAADATSTIRMGTFVLDNDFRHPAVVAKEAATLDLLSDGRLELGLGAGWMGADYEQSGIPLDPPRDRVERLQEAVSIIKQFFVAEEVSHKGRHYAIEGLKGLPKPQQSPHPPILIGAGGKRMLTFAAREADIVSALPLSQADGSGFDLSDITPEAFDKKTSWIRHAAGTKKAPEINVLVQRIEVTDDPKGAVERRAREFPYEEFPDVTPQTIAKMPLELIGTVDDICDEIIERRERFGISYLTFFEAAMETAAPIVARLSGT